MLSAARGNVKWDCEYSNEINRRKLRERIKEVRSKKLHGQFLMEMDEIASENSWSWLKTGYLKKETEGLLVAAQSQTLRTNAIKAEIDKSQENSLCRLCHQKNETVNHIVSECPKVSQTQYKRRHDTVAKALNWDLSRRYEFNSGGKWFEHAPKCVLENDKVKILWGFTIQTDRKIPHNRPDILVIDKEKNKCHIVDVAFPDDSRICLKEHEKEEKYIDLVF